MPLILINTIFLPFLGFFASLTGRKSSSRLLFISVFLILGIFRFDTSTDYSAYALAFWEIKDGVYDGYFEKGYVWINKLFAFSDYGYWFLLASTYLFFYNSFVNLVGRKSTTIALVILVLYGLNIRIENIVRQSIAMGIFLMAHRAQILGSNLKYVTLMFLGSLFHASILLVFILNLGYHFFRKIASKQQLIILVLSMLVILSTSMLDYVILSGLEMTIDPKYYQIITVALEQREIQTLMFIRTVVAFIILIHSHTLHGMNRVTYYIFLACIGHFLSGQFILFERVFEYYYLFEICILVQIISSRKISLIMLGIVSFLFVNNLYLNYNTYKWNSYKSIFTEDFIHHKFYDRILSWEKRGWTQDDYYDRTKLEQLR